MKNNLTCWGHSLHTIAVSWIPVILAEIEGNAALNSMFICLFLTKNDFYNGKWIFCCQNHGIWQQPRSLGTSESEVFNCKATSKNE